MCVSNSHCLDGQSEMLDVGVEGGRRRGDRCQLEQLGRRQHPRCDEAEVVARSRKLATEGRVKAVDGTEINFTADSICLHGDTAGAVDLAAAVRKELESAGVKIKRMSEIV